MNSAVLTLHAENHGSQISERNAASCRIWGRGGLACRAGESRAMIGPPAGTCVWIVAAVTDMRGGFVRLSGMVQTKLKKNPFSDRLLFFAVGVGTCLHAVEGAIQTRRPVVRAYETRGCSPIGQRESEGGGFEERG